MLKFGLDPVYSFGDIAIFIFCRFVLKLPIRDYLREGLGAYSPNVVTYRFNHKRTIIVRKNVV